MSGEYYCGSSPACMTPYYDLDTEEAIRNHLVTRCNMYVKRLFLPEALWKGKRVLELAPGTGANAVYLARSGAILTLVEKDPHVVELLQRNLARSGAVRNIKEIVCSKIEDYHQDSKFDVVIAEGFLYFLPDRDCQLERLAGFLDDGPALMIFHTFDPYGSFVRNAKTVYFRMLCDRFGGSNDERFSIAKRLFEDDHNAVYATRSFRRFFEDVLLCPVNGRKLFYGFEQKAPILKRRGLSLYSSWPNYHERDNVSWYKLAGNREYEESCESGYVRRIANFVCGTELHRDAYMLPPVEQALALRMVIDGCMDLFESYMEKTMPEEKLSDMVRSLDDTVGGIQHPEATSIMVAATIIKEILDLCDTALAGGQTLETMIGRYKRAATLRRYMGIPAHYLVFHKG